MATLRTPDAIVDLQSRYSTDQLLVVKLDVTKPDEIEAVFAKAKAAFGRIDVVFNNAGFVVVGEIEGTPDDKARAQFEVRHFGQLLLTSLFLTLLHEGPIFWRCQRVQDRGEVLPREFPHRRTPHPEFVQCLLASLSWGRILLRRVYFTVSYRY